MATEAEILKLERVQRKLTEVRDNAKRLLSSIHSLIEFDVDEHGVDVDYLYDTVNEARVVLDETLEEIKQAVAEYDGNDE
jgi:hypothetical protein